MFVYNGVQFDYCHIESVKSLQEFCDKVVVCVIDSNDGTVEQMMALRDSKTNVILLDDTLWNLTSGKERLSHFSNIAIANLDTDYVFYQQADEITHQDSYPVIRKAITLGEQGFFCRRYNLWNDPYHYLSCPLDRQPCSTHVIRLTKSIYRCVDDAESIACPNPSMEFAENIEISHMGFVRKRDVMKTKIRHMQETVFGMGYDKRIDLDKEFNPMRYFSREDLSPIPKPLPAVIQKWAAERLPL